jgi:hypothetical protein
MEWQVCIGIDWADKEHQCELRTRDGRRVQATVRSEPEALHAWLRSVREQHPHGAIVIAVEQGRSSLLDALMMHPWATIIPINPLASKRYRESRRLSGASSDPVDAELICDFAIKHLDELRQWRPHDQATRKLAVVGDESPHARRPAYGVDPAAGGNAQVILPSYWRGSRPLPSQT